MLILTFFFHYFFSSQTELQIIVYALSRNPDITLINSQCTYDSLATKTVQSALLPELSIRVMPEIMILDTTSTYQTKFLYVSLKFLKNSVSDYLAEVETTIKNLHEINNIAPVERLNSTVKVDPTIIGGGVLSASYNNSLFKLSEKDTSNYSNSFKLSINQPFNDLN